MPQVQVELSPSTVLKLESSDGGAHRFSWSGENLTFFCSRRFFFFLRLLSFFGVDGSLVTFPPLCGGGASGWQTYTVLRCVPLDSCGLFDLVPFYDLSSLLCVSIAMRYVPGS